MAETEPPARSADGSVSENETDFVWQDYLESTNTIEVPHILFAHVEQSLQNGFEEGMKLEVPLKEKPGCHWVASVVMSCGPLLRLRYEGMKDRRGDFWCDLQQVRARPLGWCEAQRQPLEPPDELKHVDTPILRQSFKTAISVPPELLCGEGCTPVDRIKPGMKVEIQDPMDPYRMWIATIVENVGGRLLLRYDVPEGVTLPDFWLFYSAPRVHPVGWAAERGPPWVLRRPSSVNSGPAADQWQVVLEESQAAAAQMPFPNDILNKTRKSLSPHDVVVGNKLEAIHPGTMADICPATVVKVLDSYYFVVAIDVVGVTENHQFTWLATSTHPYIFPIGWAAKHGLKVTHPRGWTCDQDEFDWPSYLSSTKATAATLSPRPALPPVPVESSMRLEAADVERPASVCVATVQRTTDHLLWIHLETVDPLVQQNVDKRFWTCFKSQRAVSWDSLDIFPVGWCESNSYKLTAPKMTQTKSTKEASPDKSSVKDEQSSQEKTSEKCSSWCPKIYFNHKCFSGPFLSKSRLASLPRFVGPGPVALVMKEVLTMLISIAYISSRVLKELQCLTHARPNMHLEMLKAKYKSNVYRANVEILDSADKVDEFCREVCRKLQVCPHLFSTVAVGQKTCPENCHTLSKTRFVNTAPSTTSSQSTLIGQRKVGRPLESRKATTFPWPRRPPSTRREYLSAFKKREAEKNSNTNDGTRNKRFRYHTRGIKLPNFGLKNSQIKATENQNGSTSSISNPFSLFLPKDTPSPTKEVTSSDVKNDVSLELAALGLRKRGRRSKAENERIRRLTELIVETKMDDSKYHVDTNPVLWTVEDVYVYMKRSHDCAVIADLLKQEEFDGQALMLLTLSACTHELHLTLIMALRLCRHVEAIKFAFFSKFVTEIEID